MKRSRQVIRAEERANDYWRPGQFGLLVPRGARSCRLPSMAGRERVSANVIASKVARFRAPRAPKHPAGLRHAWQRKAAALASLSRLIGAAA